MGIYWGGVFNTPVVGWIIFVAFLNGWALFEAMNSCGGDRITAEVPAQEVCLNCADGYTGRIDGGEAPCTSN